MLLGGWDVAILNDRESGIFFQAGHKEDALLVELLPPLVVDIALVEDTHRARIKLDATRHLDVVCFAGGDHCIARQQISNLDKSAM